MFLVLINLILLDNNKKTCNSKCFKKTCAVVFYILSLVELLLFLMKDKYFNFEHLDDTKILKLLNNNIFWFVIIFLDFTINTILMLNILKIGIFYYGSENNINNTRSLSDISNNNIYKKKII